MDVRHRGKRGVTTPDAAQVRGDLEVFEAALRRTRTHLERRWAQSLITSARDRLAAIEQPPLNEDARQRLSSCFLDAAAWEGTR